MRLYSSGCAAAEGEVLELPLQLPDAEAVGERCVDFPRLERGAALLVSRSRLEPRMSRAAARAGQHEPHVGGEREQQLAQPFGLLGRQVFARDSSRRGCRSRRLARVPARVARAASPKSARRSSPRAAAPCSKGTSSPRAARRRRRAAAPALRAVPRCARCARPADATRTASSAVLHARREAIARSISAGFTAGH